MALDDRNATTDNPLANWLLARRDAAAERLGRARRFRSIQRWRVPVAVSAFQLGLPMIVVALASTIGWFLGSAMQWAVLTAMIISFLLLVLPYGVWHPRRCAFDLEQMRPVARNDYIRQIALALAWDVFEWTLVASLISAGVFLLVDDRELAGFSSISEVAGYLGVLWGMALFTYGVALATIRRRAWLLLVASAALLWLLGIPLLIVRVDFAMGSRDSMPFDTFAILSAIVGLSLAWSSYRRWLATDLA
jgi:hypothetical protein